MKEYDIYYISISGGKDSTATLLWGMDNLPKEKILAVFLDTGNESEITLDYIKYLERKTGIKIHRILPKYSFEEIIRKKKFFPSPGVRYCTEILKIEPSKEITKILRKQIKNPSSIKNPEEIINTAEKLPANPKILVVTGVRAQESEARSKYPEFEENNPYIQCDLLRPIIQWTEKDVFEFLKKKGIDPNPLYQYGCRRVGCFPCIFAKKEELFLLFKEEFEIERYKIQKLEKDIGRKFFIYQSLEEKYNHLKNKESQQGSLFLEEKKEEEISICNVNGISFCE